MTNHQDPNNTSEEKANIDQIRIPQADADEQYRHRWSPRAFQPEPIYESTLKAIFEAARWAPSSFNEQPWTFYYARKPLDHARFSEGLIPFNQSWAPSAPVLVYVVAEKYQKKDQNPNPMARFDAGAATAYLALEARRHGLYAHVMGGIIREKVYEILGLSEERHDVICAIAIGSHGDPADLPEGVPEQITTRKPLHEVMIEGFQENQGQKNQ